MDHDCALPPEVDLLKKYIPGDSYWQKMKRTFRSVCMVSPTNLRSKYVFKSRSAIKREKQRHLSTNFYIIHPFSDFRSYWELIMIYVFIITLILTPLIVAMDIYEVPNFMLYLRICMDAMRIADIIINFFTGYVVTNTMDIVLDSRSICKHYLLTLFGIDCIASMPADCILRFLYNRSMYYGELMDALSGLKVLAFINLNRYLSYYRDRKDCSIYKFKVFKLCLLFILVMFWTLNLFYTAGIYGEKDDTWEMATYSAVYTLMLVGYGRRDSMIKYFALVKIFMVTAGIIFKLIMLAQILQLFKKYNLSYAKYQQLLQQLHEYVRYKELPDHMRRRIIKYYEFKFQKTFFKENEILSVISIPLREEITMHTCKRLVENVKLFKSLPQSVLLRIVTGMKSEVYLTEDIIVQAGTVGDSMFFIASGTVAVFTNNGREVCHLEDGGHFGEIALIMENETRVATVIAVEPCELFTLKRKDFHKAVSPYPDLYRSICNIALERLQKTLNLSEQTKESHDVVEVHLNRYAF